jgi:quercetin dioxygenase-like cupin family protein
VGHRHSGFVLGYVIEGQLRFAIDNEPERIVPAGGTFFEPIGALHSTNAAAGGAPARFVAFLVVPKGAPVVVPA